MPQRTGLCSLTECTRDAWARDLCRRHYERLMRYGDPTGTPDRPALADRIASKIEHAPSGCWQWTGTTVRHGYGRMKVNGQLRIAHRLVYESLVGPIPAGLDLDHLCRNTGCVNPAHLEPVTRGENLRRAREARVA